MDNIKTTDQCTGMILCICFDCIKVKHTIPNGKQANRVWLHPATFRKHGSRSNTESEAGSSLLTLAKEFSGKAQIADVDPTDVSFEEDDTPTTKNTNMTELICQLHQQPYFLEVS
ncbi:hypothetical protein DFH28DRAFT_893134 [Melampsora americana]|nr:hypothetical protein DFH28DRAFT_893134 [Melampsora americana]